LFAAVSELRERIYDMFSRVKETLGRNIREKMKGRVLR